MMYFWQIKNLKEDIKSEKFNEKDRYIYFMIFIVLFTIMINTEIFFPLENITTWDYIHSIFNILIPLVGIIYAFKGNGATNGKDFLGRYFAIGFVMAIRVTVYFIPVFGLWIFGLWIFSLWDFSAEIIEQQNTLTNYLDVILTLGLNTVMYWRIYVHIQDVARPITPKPIPSIL